MIYESVNYCVSYDYTMCKEKLYLLKIIHVMSYNFRKTVCWVTEFPKLPLNLDLNIK